MVFLRTNYLPYMPSSRTVGYMRSFARYRVAFTACVFPMLTFVLAYAPATLGFVMAATAAAGWCFWLDHRPGA